MKQLLVALSLLLIPPVFLFAQTEETTPTDSTSTEVLIPVDRTYSGEIFAFTEVEEQPSFNGGDVNAFSSWVGTHLKYPEIARENGVQGRVMLSFVIDPNGDMCNVEILRNIDNFLDKEAVRVVSSSPKWTPGKHQGENIAVKITFPVIFRLQ